MNLERHLQTALTDIESFKTDSCLDVNTVGHYAGNRLSELDREAAEAHVKSCPYCLKQVNDMAAMLHYSRQADAELKKPAPAHRENSLWDRLQEFFRFTPTTWRYSTIGLAAAWGIYLVIFLAGRDALKLALPGEAFAAVETLDAFGKVVHEVEGVLLGSDGNVVTPLAPLAGASRIRIRFHDGSSYSITEILKDEEKNLAVMKVPPGDGKSRTGLEYGDMKDLVGKKIYLVADPAASGKRSQEALVSGVTGQPGRKKGEATGYIQVATQSETRIKGAIVDEQGKFVGFLVTEKPHLNLATPVSDVTRLIKDGKSVPVSELKRFSFSTEAYDSYLKGILARDAQEWPDAIGHFKKAIELNPSLEGAYDELGYAYFRAHDSDREQEVYEAQLKRNPQNAEALYNYAWNLESHKKYEEAISYYEASLAQESKDIETLYQLGLSYLALAQKDKALTMWNRLKKEDEGRAELLRRLIISR